MSKIAPKSRIFLYFLIALLLVAVAAIIGLNIKVRADASQSVTLGTDWTQVLPAPPQIGGTQDKEDMAAVVAFQGLAGGADYDQAVQDVSFDMFKSQGGVLGPRFTALNYPKTKALLDYADQQLRDSTRAAKAQFVRLRPYKAATELRTCMNDPPPDGSYPSGHAAWGWLSAKILEELYPDYGPALFKRGREYGRSRIICAVHYPSDVTAGQDMADFLFVRLKEDATFQGLFAQAKQEAMNQKGPPR